MIDGELLIGNKQVINYEALSTFVYTLIISVSDGQANSDPATLTLHVIDINEAPHFSSRLYFIDVMEGKVKEQTIKYEKFFYSNHDDTNEVFDCLSIVTNVETFRYMDNFLIQLYW